MSAYPCCGAPCAYMHDPHAWNCATATLWGLPRKPAPAAPAAPAPVLKCTCGATSCGSPPVKGGGHADYCDIETGKGALEAGLPKTIESRTGQFQGWTLQRKP